MLNNFKELVDSVSPTIFIKDDFVDKYHADIDEEPFDYIERALRYDLKIKIENLNFPSGKINRTTFTNFNEELIYHEIILNENSIPYLEIIKSFLDCNPKMERLPSFDDEKWVDVIVCAKNYLNFKPDEDKLSKKNLKEHYLKEYNRSESIKYLLSKGCKIEIEKNNINFISGLDNVLNKLDHMIEKFGGINLIIHLLNNVEFNEDFQRFFFLKKTDILNQNELLEVPFGYLFNLALKHKKFKNFSKVVKYQKLLNEIVQLSSIIVNAVNNVQDYNVFTHIFPTVESFSDLVSNLVLYDSLFRIPQSNFDLELKLCQSYFSFEDNFFEETIGFSLDEFLIVLKDFNQTASRTGNRIMLRLSKKKEYPLPYGQYLKILNFMSHQGNINEDYLLPNDYSSIDYFKKPLLKLNQTSFFIPSIPIISPNFYEVLAYSLRKPYNRKYGSDLDDLLGDKLEYLIGSLFDEYGITYISNCKYDKEYEGESDFIIENDESIILIEVKKKPLVRKSKSGYNYWIFMDLFKSLAKSQVQANKLEYLLKKYGNVELELKNGSNYNLSLNGRVIKRISLTQLDYGSLYNPHFVKFFLYTLINGKYVLESDDVKFHKEFDNIKKIIEEYEESYIQLDIPPEEFNYFAQSNTYFLSLSQLYEVIKRSTDNNSFNENLPKNYMETGTFDWFFEYSKFLNIKKMRDDEK
ncbi:hypothetical protein [uncultured Methanobrevibacter sp.]|uniref:hypothetical protein n=1 Tax=uncultured Methanobrevibacter sp. TaxID=253161 RepID=UPI0025F20D62|nr:hypothetical protein [uncultured Methanobrevibacter sp.]